MRLTTPASLLALLPTSPLISALPTSSSLIPRNYDGPSPGLPNALDPALAARRDPGRGGYNRIGTGGGDTEAEGVVEERREEDPGRGGYNRVAGGGSSDGDNDDDGVERTRREPGRSGYNSVDDDDEGQE